MGDDSSIGEWLLKKRFDELSLNFRTVWDLYLKFYTVFLTFNIAALAWAYGKTPALDPRWPIAAAFIVQNLLTAITSASMAVFSKTSERRILEVLRQLAAFATAKRESGLPESDLRVDLPIPIAVWGGWANCAGVTTVTGIWITFWASG